MTEFILVTLAGTVAWLLFSGAHIYITNHLMHAIFPKKVADNITRFVKKLP